jgi:hypothetical protein
VDFCEQRVRPAELTGCVGDNDLFRIDALIDRHDPCDGWEKPDAIAVICTNLGAAPTWPDRKQPPLVN